MRVVLEAAVWIALLGFVFHRVSPQIGAALGVGGGDSPAPAFELRTLEGEVLSAGDLRGRVVVVNFWATWCPPCRVEMPGFQRVYEDRRGDGLVVLGIAMDRTGDGPVREFLRERGITFPVAMATGKVVREFGHVRVLPTSFLIDREGRVRREVKGFFAEPTLRMAVDRLLGEAWAGEDGRGGVDGSPPGGYVGTLRMVLIQSL